MKKPMLYLITVLMLGAQFGCKKSEHDTASKIGQFTEENRLVMGVINEGGEPIFMPVNKIETAFNLSFPSLIAQKVSLRKGLSKDFQLIIEAENTLDDSHITFGFSLNVLLDEIIFAPDQCTHTCTAVHPCCGCALTFNGCEGSCACTCSGAHQDPSDGVCTHQVSGGGGGPVRGGIAFFGSTVGEFMSKISDQN